MVLANIALLILIIIFIFLLVKMIFIIASSVVGYGHFKIQDLKDRKNPSKTQETKNLLWHKCEIIEKEINHAFYNCEHYIFQEYGCKLGGFAEELGLRSLSSILTDTDIEKKYLYLDDIFYKDYGSFENIPNIISNTHYNYKLDKLYDNTIKEALNLKYENFKTFNPSLSYNEWEYAYYLNVRILIVEAIILGLNCGWKWHFDYRTYPPYRHHRYPQINYQEYAIYNLGWTMEYYGGAMDFYGFIPENTDIKRIKELYKDIKDEMHLDA